METDGRRSPPTSLRRYRWDHLSEPEKDAVKDAAIIASTRSAVGIGAALTTAALISSARRGKPPLPSSIRYGAFPFFTLVAGYIGFVSGGPMYARRILSVPNSRLGEDLRVVIGDWDARLPTNVDQDQQGPHEQLPDGKPSPDQDVSTLPGPERTDRKPRKDL